MQKFQFGSLEQGNDSVMDVYVKVKNFNKLLGNEECHLKNQFLRGLSLENQIDAD